MSIVSVAIVMSLLTPHAAACEITTSTPDQTLQVGDKTYYLAIDCAWPIKDCSPGPIWLALVFWLYEETNGMPGLQRHDDWGWDTCGDPTLADTVILS